MATDAYDIVSRFQAARNYLDMLHAERQEKIDAIDREIREAEDKTKKAEASFIELLSYNDTTRCEKGDLVFEIVRDEPEADPRIEVRSEKTPSVFQMKAPPPPIDEQHQAEDAYKHEPAF